MQSSRTLFKCVQILPVFNFNLLILTGGVWEIMLMLKVFETLRLLACSEVRQGLLLREWRTGRDIVIEDKLFISYECYYIILYIIYELDEN